MKKLKQIGIFLADVSFYGIFKIVFFSYIFFIVLIVIGWQRFFATK